MSFGSRAGTLCLLATAMLLGSALPVFAWDLPYKLDEHSAQTLAAEAHDGSTKWVNDYVYGEAMAFHRPFFVFQELGKYQGSAGFFAVNPWTGKVWDLWSCKEIETPASHKIQAELRKQFTQDELKQYKQLGSIQPECM